MIVGGGPEEARLRALAGASVEFLSGIPAERLRELYRSCALYLQPGEEDFGISAVEALACGTPVVALARGGALDIVRDGENGVLYDGDTDGASPPRSSGPAASSSTTLPCEPRLSPFARNASPKSSTQAVRELLR